MQSREGALPHPGQCTPQREVNTLVAVVQRGKLRFQIGQRAVELIGMALMLAQLQITLYAGPGKQ